METRPQVIIVEPSYNDGPHIGLDHPNDNHLPLAIGWGEDFAPQAVIDKAEATTGKLQK